MGHCPTRFRFSPKFSSTRRLTAFLYGNTFQIENIFPYENAKAAVIHYEIAMRKEEYLVKQLRDWLQEQGLQPEVQQKIPGQGLRLDLVVRGCRPEILVEAKAAQDYRSKIFPALIGDVLLRAKHDYPSSDLLVAFLIKNFNQKAVHDLEAYADSYMPKLHWFLLDESGIGVARLHGKEHSLELPPISKDSSRRPKSSSPRSSPFRPIDRHLMKILLMPGINPRYWGGPQRRPDGIGNLARAAGVSQPSASKFVKRFEAKGYIRREARELIVMRHEELLDDWFHALKHEMDKIPVRSMYGDPPEKLVERLSVKSELKAPLAGIVGHHLACHFHGVGRSSVKSAIIYAPQELSDQLMHDRDLVEDDSDSPSIWIVHRDFDSVSQGAVIANGVWVCDILQCYLDVRSAKARGQEQADYVLENILLPHFRSAS